MNGIPTFVDYLKFGFFVQWHINHRGLLNAKAIILEEQQWYYLTNNQGDKGVHTFPKGISSKVNVIARLVFELGYFEVAVQHPWPLRHGESLPHNKFIVLYMSPTGSYCTKKGYDQNSPAGYQFRLLPDTPLR